jgi:hypothetical protein
MADNGKDYFLVKNYCLKKGSTADLATPQKKSRIEGKEFTEN